MRIIAKWAPVTFWTRHPEIEQPLKAWHQTVKHVTWANSAEVKQTFAKVSIINHERVGLDILGGNYRLIASIDYKREIVFAKFLGTHSEYDKIDAATVSSY